MRKVIVPSHQSWIYPSRFRKMLMLPFLFFWCLLLSCANAYVIFKYRTSLEESLPQKALYFLGGAFAYAYNLCFPWMITFMDSHHRPLLLVCYLLCNLATAHRMMHIDRKNHLLSAWKEEFRTARYAILLRLEKYGTALFIAISAGIYWQIGL